MAQHNGRSGRTRQYKAGLAAAGAKGSSEVQGTGLLPPKRTDSLKAIPFAGQTIPDIRLAEILEILETESCTLEDAAQRVDYPVLLLQLCLTDYERRWKSFLLARSL